MYTGFSALPSTMMKSYPENLSHAPKSAPHEDRAKAPVKGLRVHTNHRDTAWALVPARGPVTKSILFCSLKGSVLGARCV